MSIKSKRRHQAQFASAIIGTASLATFVSADVIDTTWLGGSGSWQTPSQWSGGAVPNNTGTTTYRASVPAGSLDTAQFYPQPGITVDFLQIAGPAYLQSSGTLTINNELDVNGNVFVAGSLNLGAGALLQGGGTIAVGRNGFVTTGCLTGKSAFTVPSGLNIQIAGDSSRIGSPGNPFVNQGYIYGGTDNDNLRLQLIGSTLTNVGTIEAKNGAIALGGTFTRADLGTLVWGQDGTFGVGGTLLNQNQTLVVDTAHSWELDGGTIQGGIIQIAPGSSLNTIFPTADITGYTGTLDNVVINGRISHNGAGSLNISNGLLQGNAEIVLGAGGIPGAPQIVTTSSSLTIASTVFIHGIGGEGLPFPGRNSSGVGDGSGAIVNHGTIQSDPGSQEFDILGTSITNDGELSVNPKGVMYVGQSHNTATSLTFQSGGALQVNMSYVGIGLLDVNGTLDLSSAGDSLLLSADTLVQPFTYYRIATASGGIFGQFDSVTPGFEVQYTSNDIFARIVPEPQAVVLALGFAVARAARRRRTRFIPSMP